MSGPFGAVLPFGGKAGDMSYMFDSVLQQDARCLGCVMYRFVMHSKSSMQYLTTDTFRCSAHLGRTWRNIIILTRLGSIWLNLAQVATCKRSSLASKPLTQKVNLDTRRPTAHDDGSRAVQ